MEILLVQCSVVWLRRMERVIDRLEMSMGHRQVRDAVANMVPVGCNSSQV